MQTLDRLMNALVGAFLNEVITEIHSPAQEWCKPLPPPRLDAQYMPPIPPAGDTKQVSIAILGPS